MLHGVRVAITGRGKEVQAARQLVEDMGGEVTKKDSEAQLLVAVLGAGKKKIADAMGESIGSSSTRKLSSSTCVVTLPWLRQCSILSCPSLDDAPPKPTYDQLSELLMLNASSSKHHHQSEDDDGENSDPTAVTRGQGLGSSADNAPPAAPRRAARKILRPLGSDEANSTDADELLALFGQMEAVKPKGAAAPRSVGTPPPPQQQQQQPQQFSHSRAPALTPPPPTVAAVSSQAPRGGFSYFHINNAAAPDKPRGTAAPASPSSAVATAPAVKHQSSTITAVVTKGPVSTTTLDPADAERIRLIRNQPPKADWETYFRTDSAPQQRPPDTARGVRSGGVAVDVTPPRRANRHFDETSPGRRSCSLPRRPAHNEPSAEEKRAARIDALRARLEQRAAAAPTRRSMDSTTNTSGGLHNSSSSRGSEKNSSFPTATRATMENAPSTRTTTVSSACNSYARSTPRTAAPTPTEPTQTNAPPPAAAAVVKRPPVCAKPPLPPQARGLGLRPVLPSSSSQRGGGAMHSDLSEEEQRLMQIVRASPHAKAVDEESAAQVLRQIVDRACPVTFDSISGLKQCKQILFEAVILPARRPELFTGLRRPCSGLLLFGPPGNGKTMLAKAVARECGTTFFNISASAITSKWLGDSEKMVRALFGVARALAPSTVFIDEIDSLLLARGSGSEGEGSRRLKTEFLVQMDGAGNSAEEARVLIMGATNRPFDLDDAVLRRFPKKVLVPLPDETTRRELLRSVLSGTSTNFKEKDWSKLADETNFYSGNDLANLCKELAMVPLRELGEKAFEAQVEDLRPVVLKDAIACLKIIRPSASAAAMERLAQWDAQYGSSTAAI